MLVANYNALIEAPYVIAHQGYARLIDRDETAPHSTWREVSRRYIVEDLSARNYGTFKGYNTLRGAKVAMRFLAQTYGSLRLDQ